MNNRHVALLLGVAAILLPAPRVYSGSLEKYQAPPIQQSLPDTSQQRSQSTRPVLDLPVYQNFRSYVSDLPTEELEGLIKTYLARKQQAAVSRDWSQVTYYNNLIDILLDERRRR